MKNDYTIFSTISDHMVQGLMIHDQIYRAFLFLRLYSFAKDHLDHYFKESKAYTKLNKYYITHRHKLLEAGPINASSIIPMSIMNEDRLKIVSTDLSQATRYLINTWVDWEKRTKDLYTTAWSKLVELGYAAEADYVLKLVKDVDDELSDAESLSLRLEGIGYDTIELMDMNK